MSRNTDDGQVARAGPVRLLTLTSLFPSAARPRHGIFVETRLNRLVATGHVTASVIAPVPWFPFAHPVFGRYASLARTPSTDVRNGLAIAYPRYWMVPKAGLRWQANSMARAVMRHLRGTPLSSRPELIEGQYLYPDGVASALVAGRLGCPYVLTARGTDVNVLAQDPRVQPAILRAVAGAAITVTVSAALRNSLVALGCDAESIVCLRNGVDLDLFRPQDRQRARAALGIHARHVIASVGNLVAEKRHSLVIEALVRIPDAVFLVVGEGPERTGLERRSRELGVRDRVVFLSGRPQRELVDVYSAADVLALPSRREGWPNVVLEAMACGTPVVASDVGGVGEMITTRVAGIVVPGDEPADFAAAVLQVLGTPPDRVQVREHAERFDWESIVDRQGRLYRKAVRDAHPYASQSLAARPSTAAGELTVRT